MDKTMTNKLPEVGKRYLSKKSGNILTIKQVRNDITIITDGGDLWTPEYFSSEFEELPEDNSNQKHQLEENTLADEVEKAKEELRQELQEFEKAPVLYKFYEATKNSKDNYFVGLYTLLHRKAQKLLNALDSTKTQAEPIVDNKIETKLPWKDVSELPEKEISAFDCLIKLHAGDIIRGKYFAGDFYTMIFHPDMSLHKIRESQVQRRAIVKFCTLTDLINSIESMLSRQDEFEERIRKLEGKCL
jgi:hypothetical protein